MFGLIKAIAVFILLIPMAITAVNAQEFFINKQLFQLSAAADNFEIHVKTEKVANDVNIATITLSAKTAQQPPKFTLNWKTPSIDVAGVWTPAFNVDYIIPADWSSKKLESMLTRNAPVYTLFGHDDVNRYTVSVDDAINLVHMSAKIREEDSFIYHEIEFLSEKHKKVKQYQVKVRLDTRAVPFYQSLNDVAKWWQQDSRYTPTFVPDDALEPMYSTWYSYHQSVEHESLLAEAKVAASLGYKAIIVDDGWQTNDSNRGYAYTGDWKPERLTNIKSFVDDIHQLGMKAILWYSIPFVGEKAEVADRFQGKYLNHSKGLETYVLDPRYPEVREYLIGHYEQAIKVWGWDGLKLDFIDQFKSYEDTILEKKDGRDFASVYVAVDKLMTDLIDRLKAINPDVMVEFRQRYIGPAMRKYGNMFRATDIPNGAVTNKKRIVNLRVLSGDTAVHSDMLMWHYDEPAEIAALQLLNVLYSVPQISVRLAELPKSHFDMVTHYTAYWKENKDILLAGKFSPQGVLANYPLITSTARNKQITTVYDDLVVNVPEKKSVINKVDIVNAKKSKNVVAKLNPSISTAKVVIKNAQGNIVKRYTVNDINQVLLLEVPVSGIASLQF